MRKLLYLSISSLLLIVSLPFSSYADSDELNLEVELSKQTYLLHEPIWLDITFTNSSSDTLRTHSLRYPNHRGFEIVMKNSDGELLEYTGFKAVFGAQPGWLLLQPGEQDYGSFNLIESFGTHTLYGAQSWRFPIIPAGQYTVQAQYQGFTSNELTFDIVEPAGEEIEVLVLIKQASKIWDRDNREPSAQLFQKVVDDYPNSVFAERCLYFSLSYAPKVNDAKMQGTYDDRSFNRELLMKCPNSGNSKFWFMGAAREYDDNQKLEFAKELLEQHPNTRLSKYVSQIRKRLLYKQEEK